MLSATKKWTNITTIEWLHEPAILKAFNDLQFIKLQRIIQAINAIHVLGRSGNEWNGISFIIYMHFDENRMAASGVYVCVYPISYVPAKRRKF